MHIHECVYSWKRQRGHLARGGGLWTPYVTANCFATVLRPTVSTVQFFLDFDINFCRILHGSCSASQWRRHSKRPCSPPLWGTPRHRCRPISTTWTSWPACRKLLAKSFQWWFVHKTKKRHSVEQEIQRIYFPKKHFPLWQGLPRINVHVTTCSRRLPHGGRIGREDDSHLFTGLGLNELSLRYYHKQRDFFHRVKGWERRLWTKKKSLWENLVDTSGGAAGQPKKGLAVDQLPADSTRSSRCTPWAPSGRWARPTTCTFGEDVSRSSVTNGFAKAGYKFIILQNNKP